MNKILLTLALFATGILLYGQSNLPIIKAGSRNVDIIDGLHIKKGYWYIMPEKKPDYYFVEIPHKKHNVTFITDVDSISFDIEYGQVYDFIILLANKDSCYTRIVAKENEQFNFTGTASSTTDTIPFTIGDNSKVYFKGTVNNSELLDIQFDLGLSGQSIIKKSSVKKVNMNFDGSIVLTNSDGTSTVPSSSHNKLKISNLSWDSIPFSMADNMTYREDIIIGNILFRHKVVEFNYDEKIIILHDSMPAVDSRFKRHDIILDNATVPFLRADLTYNSITKPGWYMFDIGAYTSIFNNKTIPPLNKMFTEAKKMVGLNYKTKQPQIKIGDYVFSDFNYTTQDISREDIAGLLGNDLLKRFNIILDNLNGVIYLKPNSQIKEPYANPERYLVRVVAVFLVLLVILISYIFYRRKKRRVKK